MGTEQIQNRSLCHFAYGAVAVVNVEGLGVVVNGLNRVLLGLFVFVQLTDAVEGDDEKE